MKIDKTKYYLFNAEQAPYLDDIESFVFSGLAKEQEKSLQSDFFSNTPYKYGLVIEVDEEKLPVYCHASLIYKSLAKLENYPEQPKLVEALRAYLNPPKLKKPIDLNLLQDVAGITGTAVVFFSSFYIILLIFLAVANLAIPMAPILGILVSFLLSMGTVYVGRKLGEFIGSKAGHYINKNRIRPNLEKNLEKLIFENNYLLISKQKMNETDSFSVTSNSSAYLFSGAKFLERHEGIEKKLNYRNIYKI